MRHQVRCQHDQIDPDAGPDRHAGRRRRHRVGRSGVLAAVSAALVTIVAGLLGAVVPAAPVDAADPAPCDPQAGNGRSADLTAAFAGGPAGVTGADYQRLIELPDGRSLWTFQDAFVRRPNGPDALVHNVGLVQEGTCFTLLRSGTAESPKPWIAGDLTDRFRHWFWPLGAGFDDDGTLRIFVAELRERGDRYLSGSEPVATWMATIDPVTLGVVAFAPAPDPGAGLHGWSVAADEEHTYLYGHCYRQFGHGFLGHDPCAASLTVARVAGHDLDRAPEYWDGRDWVADPAAAADVAPHTGPDGERRTVNPSQVRRFSDAWLAVTKEGDWWGSTIYLDTAPAPAGPWTTGATLAAEPLGPTDTFNTYFASFGPSSGDSIVVGVSNNRWDGRQSDAYRPTFRDVPLRLWGAEPESDPSPSRSARRRR
jgi:hypothetical protein